MTVDRRMRITRLGQDVDRDGRLASEAVSRTLAVLGDYHEAWTAYGAERVRITATSAVRDATDRDAFLDAVVDRTGVRPEVLPGTAEAALAHRGAVSGVGPLDGPVLVLDIGGGSTELVRGTATTVDAAASVQIGAVRLTEQALHDDPPTPAQVQQARALADTVLADLADQVEPSPHATLVGTAGTVTTIAALHLGLDAYRPEAIHGTRLPATAVATWAERLCAMSAAQRRDLPPMEPGRADVIAGGAIVLDAVCTRLGVDEVLVSEADILDGIALSLLG